MCQISEGARHSRVVECCVRAWRAFANTRAFGDSARGFDADGRVKDAENTSLDPKYRRVRISKVAVVLSKLTLWRKSL